MPSLRANGIDLEYDVIGSAEDPPLLLVMGLGGQLISWPEEFCVLLARRGYRVIRYDNRDVGLSTKFEGAPDLAALLGGDLSQVPYRLADLADDAAGLLDGLGVDAAHVVGISMGGMIAQSLAIAHGQRCLTLTSIMSTTGAPGVGAPRPETLPVLMTPAPVEREAIIDHQVRNARAIASPGFPFDEVEHRQRAIAYYERAWHPEGVARQLAAIVASPDRTAALGEVAVPTLVIHGSDDPLVQVDGGRATAAAVPGAAWLEIPGMGHDLPRPAWPQLVDAIASHAVAPASLGDRS